MSICTRIITRKQFQFREERNDREQYKDVKECTQHRGRLCMYFFTAVTCCDCLITLASHILDTHTSDKIGCIMVIIHCMYNYMRDVRIFTSFYRESDHRPKHEAIFKNRE